MPRSRSSGPSRSAPSRPTAPPASRPAPQQTRAMSTSPTQQAHPPQAAQQSGGSGLFGQMASTAAGVAVGSSIGHAIGGFFGGGSSSQAPAAEQQSYKQPADSYAQPGQAMDSSWYSTNAQQQQQQRTMGEERCAMDAKNFTKCLDDNQGNMQTCMWYLDQLKACQAAARNY